MRELMRSCPRKQPRGPPLRSTSDPPDGHEEIQTAVPISPTSTYDIKEVVRAVLDGKRYFFEVQATTPPTSSSGSAGSTVRAVGVVANSPRTWRGCLDIGASLKGARFVRSATASTSRGDVRGRARFCPAQAHGVQAASSSTRAKSSLRLLRATVRSSRDHAQRPTAAPTASCPRSKSGGDVHLALPDGGDRGHGAGRRSQHPLPPRDG